MIRRTQRRNYNTHGSDVSRCRGRVTNSRSKVLIQEDTRAGDGGAHAENGQCICTGDEAYVPRTGEVPGMSARGGHDSGARRARNGMVTQSGLMFSQLRWLTDGVAGGCALTHGDGCAGRLGVSSVDAEFFAVVPSRARMMRYLSSVPWALMFVGHRVNTKEPKSCC